MKHESYFNDFLTDHVNLNQTRLTKLEERVTTITKHLKEKLDGYRKYSEQGSYAHKTIIKPVQDNDEFDADILIFINDENFDPNNFSTDYVDDIYTVFRDSDNYKDKVKRETRCVKINYAEAFHLDVVPCIEYADTHYICNRKDEKYEKTDGDGYKGWLVDKNKVVGGNNFRKTTRLLKFLRDHKDNFTVKSILLATLLGNQVNNHKSNLSKFSDLPTTLKTLSNRLNDFLQQHPTMPIVSNPVMLKEENFNRHWDQNKYANFRNKFDIYNEKINRAFEEEDHNASVLEWRKLFGDDFGKLKKDLPASTKASTPLPIPKGIPAQKPYMADD